MRWTQSDLCRRNFEEVKGKYFVLLSISYGPRETRPFGTWSMGAMVVDGVPKQMQTFERRFG